MYLVLEHVVKWLDKKNQQDYYGEINTGNENDQAVIDKKSVLCTD